MRKIKFRAWNKKTKEFVYTGIDYVIYENHMCENNYGDFIRLTDLETPEQFTGLHDKNGVEIWEGDRVVFQFCQTRYNAIVKYDIKNARYILNLYEYHDSNVGLNELDGKNYYLEVIGNIHEEGKK
jgi:uncharacterized phage protein (TIGR01671 family)